MKKYKQKSAPKPRELKIFYDGLFGYFTRVAISHAAITKLKISIDYGTRTAFITIKSLDTDEYCIRGTHKSIEQFWDQLTCWYGDKSTDDDFNMAGFALVECSPGFKQLVIKKERRRLWEVEKDSSGNDTQIVNQTHAVEDQPQETPKTGEEIIFTSPSRMVVKDLVDYVHQSIAKEFQKQKSAPKKPKCLKIFYDSLLDCNEKLVLSHAAIVTLEKTEDYATRSAFITIGDHDTDEYRIVGSSKSIEKLWGGFSDWHSDRSRDDDFNIADCVLTEYRPHFKKFVIKELKD